MLLEPKSRQNEVAELVLGKTKYKTKCRRGTFMFTNSPKEAYIVQGRLAYLYFF